MPSLPISAEPVASRRAARLVVALMILASSIIATPSTVEAQPVPSTSGNGFGVRPEEGEVIRLYQAVFGRQPDAGGFDFWAHRRVNGQPLNDIAAFFLLSDEFERRFGDPTNAGFVDLLYQNVLGRRPDSGGRAFWIGRLEAGATRRSIVLGFSESDEFRDATGTSLPVLDPFESGVSAVTATMLGSSWRSGCPVGPSELRQLTVSTIDFDGRSTPGVIVVHEDVAQDVSAIFEAMYRARMPIEGMRPASEFGADDLRLMEANITSGFNCRRVTGGQSWSRHAFGRAIDINPRFNPYVSSTQVLPASGAEWADRTRYHPAMLFAADPAVRTARDLGWTWGGDFRSISDPQHFER